MIILIALATFVSTLVGGLIALRFKDKLHLILGFSAGAVLGVAFFDLIPESIEMLEGSFEISAVMGLVALGFFGYLLLDRLVFFHDHGVDTCEHEEHQHHQEQKRGVFGAGSLALHSFLDGAAIGLAFQVSTAVGIIVAVAVLVHDFSDGINTVNLILKNKGDKKTAFKFLLADAIAPVLGVASTFFFTLPEQTLGIVLSLFAGFFLYIGASDLIPESHHSHPKFLTTFMTIVGVVVLYVVISIAGV